MKTNMSNKNNKRNKNHSARETGQIRNTSLSSRWFAPVFIALAIVPVIILAIRYDPNLREYIWYGTNETDIDFYLYAKSVVLMIVGVVALFIMCYLIPKSRDAIDMKRALPAVIAAGVFFMMTLVSSVLSEHKDMAFFGGNNRFFGCLALLSCVLIFLMAYGYIQTEKLIRITLDAVLIGAFIIGFMGTLQFLGIEPLNFPPVKGIVMLLIPGGSQLDVGYIQGASTASLFNPNYMGSYAPLVIPYCIYVVIRGKGMTRRLIACITSVLMLISLYGCGSDAGMIAAMAGVFVCVFLLLPYMKRIIRIIVILAGAVVMAGAVYVLLSHDIINNFFTTAEESHIIENMKTRKNGVDISLYDGRKLSVDLDAETMLTPGWSESVPLTEMLKVTDKSSDTELSFTTTELTDEEITAKGLLTEGITLEDLSENAKTRVVISTEGYPALSFYSDAGMLSADVTIDGTSYMFDRFHIVDGEYEWSFLDIGEGVLQYINDSSGKSAPLKNVERVGFEGKYAMASGRGYIWACTIPLLKDHLITGAGPDNFAFEFPNDDFVWIKYNGAVQYFANPHNMYMLIWVEEGLIALIAFIFLYGLFIVRAIKMCYRRRKRSYEADTELTEDAEGVVIVTAIGTTAYMVAGLANDHMVCVAPVFWVLLGVGYAAEAMWKRT